MMRRFWSVVVARNKEFMRDKAALAWNFVFPVGIILGFAFAFSGEPAATYKMGYVGELPRVENSINAIKHIDFVRQANKEQAIAKIERHQLDLFIDFEQQMFWLNSTSDKGYFMQKLLSTTSQSHFKKVSVAGSEIRYIDWLIPGILGMNMMFNTLFGIGYVIVRYRKNGVLKRLKATPLSKFEFLSAQIISRLFLIMVVTFIVFVLTDSLFDFVQLGSYWHLLLIFLLGSVCMISLGLLMAVRSSSEEFAAGILNLISMPMMFLSGVWFSLEGLHPWVQAFAYIFPLTHMIHALRAVMTEGAGLVAVSSSLSALAVMTLVFLGLGVLLFKWE